MTEEMEELRGQVAEILQGIQKTLEQMNSAPNTIPEPVPTQGVADQGISQVSRGLSTADRFALRKELRGRSTPELLQMFNMQALKRDAGVPFESWVSAGGTSVAAAFSQADFAPETRKAIDTGAASALIRQDLEPFLYELYIREFPAWERFPKEPANGLVHAYNQITSFGDAQFMSELGTVTDDQSVYTRKTTNVAIIATRRGLSLKSQFAVQAGGMGYSPEQLELTGGLRAIAHKMQKTLFQGQSTDSGGTAANELGLYDANSFDGLRSILNTARVKNITNPTVTTPPDMRAAIDRAAEEISEQGGRASIIWCHPHEKVSFDLQQDKNVRYMNQFVDIGVGVQTNAVNTVFGPLPLAVVPGDSIGTYVTTNADGDFDGGETVRDMYLLDESTITMPYLGTDGPTVLDIPVGIAGQLTRLFIIFGMWGLAVKAIPFSNKVRVEQ